MPRGMSNYLAPDRWAKDDTKLGWVGEAIKEGANYNSLCRAHIDLEEAALLIAGLDSEETIPDGLSHIRVPEVKRCLKEIIGTLSNFGTLGTYSNDNKLYNKHSFILNKCLQSWWFSSFADRQWRRAIQRSAVEGTGYISPIWSKNFWCFGRGDVELLDYGVDDVFFIQLPKDHDMQKSYAVIIKRELPYNMVVAMHPTFADKISPNHGTATWLGKGRRAVEKYLAPVLQVLGVGSSPREEQGGFPTVDYYTAYIMDTSINEGPDPVPMGVPGSSWYYTVPVWKSDVPSGTNDRNGSPQYHKATAEEAMLYPLRRRIIATDDCIIEDDSSPWWHGKVPLCRIRLDDWYCDHLGYSLIRDVKSIEDSNNNILRAAENSMVARLDPALQYDEDQIAESDMQTLDPRQRGVRVATNFQMGDGVKPLLNASYYDVPQNILEHVKANEERIRHLLSVGAYQSLAKAKQIPSGEGIDKILEAASPIMADQSYGLAREMREMCEMYKSLAFQFYSAPRMMQLGGPNMITEEFWMFDPAGIVPSHLPGEDVEKPSALNQVQRARWHQNNIIFNVATKNLHDQTSTKFKLILMQLKKSGFPIDPWFEAEIHGFADKFGKPPDEAGTTILERYLYWLGMKSEIEQAISGGGGGGAGGGKQKGRPPTGQAGPKVVQKEGGARSTVSESR